MKSQQPSQRAISTTICKLVPFLETRNRTVYNSSIARFKNKGRYSRTCSSSSSRWSFLGLPQFSQALLIIRVKVALKPPWCSLILLVIITLNWVNHSYVSIPRLLIRYRVLQPASYTTSLKPHESHPNIYADPR